MEHERHMSGCTSPSKSPSKGGGGEMNINDELEYAARAGIHLLEENSQLVEETYHLKNQIQHLESEKKMLKYLLKERNDNIEKLTAHLRESLVESQKVLSELNQTKLKVVTLEERIIELQQQQQKTSLSPSKLSRRHSSQHLNSPPSSPPLSPPRSLYERCINKQQQNTNQMMTTMTMAHDRNRLLTLRLSEAELKLDEEHKEMITLKSENKSLQKQIAELKSVQMNLLETECELKRLEKELEEHKKQEAISQEERQEEHALINSLRKTIEVYQVESWSYDYYDDKKPEQQMDTMMRKRKKKTININSCMHQIDALKMMLSANQSKQTQSTQWENCPEFKADQETIATTSDDKSENTWILLRHLLHQWSCDKSKSKQMLVVDWAMHVLGHTGKCKPLVIDSLETKEIAQGFEFMFVYLFKEVFNVNNLRVAKRQRTVTLTDIKVEVVEQENNTTSMDTNANSRTIPSERIRELLYSLHDYEKS
jgi:hypothetical protein